MTFVPNHDLVSEGTPARWMLVLHGIFGSGANWRTFARRFVAARPDWGAVLVDLRMHGSSQGARPPHTVEAAAADLVALESALDGPVGGITGHSFGGKVALQYAATRDAPLTETWILDSDPAADPDAFERATPGSTVAVLRMLGDLPATFPSRAAFVDEVVARGFARPLAQWLGMNAVRDGDAYRSRLDPAAVGALLKSYYDTDLWPAVERWTGGALHFVVAGRSTAVSPASRAHMATCRCDVHEIPEASHWLHVDSLDALVDLVAAVSTQNA